MHNWWNQWATQIARILAEWWLLSKSDRNEPGGYEPGGRLSDDSRNPEADPNSSNGLGSKEQKPPT